uniref:Uncharacterized protein n=1 Tax=Oryza nivara TaxID=4536 RepID=A0A0E0FNK4_ORYNI
MERAISVVRQNSNGGYHWKRPMNAHHRQEAENSTAFLMNSNVKGSEEVPELMLTEPLQLECLCRPQP